MGNGTKDRDGKPGSPALLDPTSQNPIDQPLVILSNKYIDICDEQYVATLDLELKKQQLYIAYVVNFKKCSSEWFYFV